MDYNNRPITTRPDILEQSIQASQAEYLLRISPELIYFAGHFPGVPILPGVTQIDWALYFASPLMSSDAVYGMKNIKFMRLIRPETSVSLLLQVSDENQSVSFRYFDKGGAFSSGQLLLK